MAFNKFYELSFEKIKFGFLHIFQNHKKCKIPKNQNVHETAKNWSSGGFDELKSRLLVPASIFCYRIWPEVSKNCQNWGSRFLDMAAERPYMI